MGAAAASDACKAFPAALRKRWRAEGWHKASDLRAALRHAYADADDALSAHEYEGCTATTLCAWRTENGEQ